MDGTSMSDGHDLAYHQSKSSATRKAVATGQQHARKLNNEDKIQGPIASGIQNQQQRGDQSFI